MKVSIQVQKGKHTIKENRIKEQQNFFFFFFSFLFFLANHQPKKGGPSQWPGGASPSMLCQGTRDGWHCGEYGPPQEHLTLVGKSSLPGDAPFLHSPAALREYK